MAAILVGLRGGNGQQGGSQYYPVGASVNSTLNQNLAAAQITSPAGDYSQFSINVLSYYGPSNTLRLHLNVNGSDTLLIAPPAGATGRFENLSDVVTVAEGDLVAWRFQGSGAPYTNSCGPLTAVFEAASGQPSHNLVATGISTTWGSGTSYAPPAGASGPVPSNETANTDIARAAAVYSNLQVRVNTNARTSDVTLFFRRNNADTGLTLTVPAGTTGRFEDAVNTVTVAPGDVIGYRAAGGGGTGNINVLWVGSRATATGGQFDLFSASPGAGSNTGSPLGWSPSVGSGGVSTTETSVELKVHLDAELSRLRVYVSQINGSMTFVTRINGADGNQTLSVPTNTAGYYEDAVNVDAVFAGDTFSVQSNKTGSGARISSLATTWFTGAMPTATLDPPPGELELEGSVPLIYAGFDLRPPADSLVISGGTAEFAFVYQMRPPAGELVIEGFAPNMGADGRIQPLGGQVAVSGALPSLLVGIALQGVPGALVVEGETPAIMTEVGALATQQAVLAIGELEPNVSASQLAALAIAQIIPPARVSQQAALAMAEVIPPVAASQQAVLVLGDGDPCVTERCQIWTITRRDGVVFRYTSLDRDLRYGGQVYSSCRSLNPSASENASTLGSTGNIELDGIIDDDGISEADLYGGLFDDAFVTVDLVSWGAPAEAPRRLASGWTGELSQGETGFKMEVLGAGARIDQQALVQMVTPGCRWTFGSAECGVNIEALAISGTVTAAGSRGRFLALLAGDGAGRQWENGTVRWTSGENVGQVVEVKTVDFGSGAIALWASPAFLPVPGDAFTLLPGCDKVREGGCTVYANVINHGGFPDVPGGDALLETPDAKY